MTMNQIKRILKIPLKVSKVFRQLNRGKIVEFYYRRLRRSPAIIRDNRGFLFEFQPDDESFAHLINKGTFTDDPSVLLYIERTVKIGDVVLDVGANIGAISILLGKLVGSEGKILSFEAELTNFIRLCRNLTLNKLESVVTPLHLAVYSHEGIIELNVFPRSKSQWNTIGLFELQGFNPIKKEIVTCVALDDFCAKRDLTKIAMLKIDIEGAEPEAFAGAIRLLTSHTIERVIFEISMPPLEGMGHKINDVVDPLITAGYTIWNINDDGTISGPKTQFEEIYFANLIALAPGVEG
jgi:FkbM family methyltransferase